MFEVIRKKVTKTDVCELTDVRTIVNNDIEAIRRLLQGNTTQEGSVFLLALINADSTRWVVNVDGYHIQPHDSRPFEVIAPEQ
jgi:hypothetical protein